MDGSRLEEGSSPLATSEDIQRRLLRPLLHSQHSSTCTASPRCNEIIPRNSSKLDENTELQKKGREVKKIKRLEDYLDPVLLSTIREKIGGERKNYGIEMKKAAKSEPNKFDWFDWPEDHHELMVLSGRSRRSNHQKMKSDD